MLKIHVTLHLMLEVRNEDHVNCITYLRIRIFYVLASDISLCMYIDLFKPGAH